jgi:5-methyltetrahydropteroyltriglutamate--homocysteine methyltransferase
MPNGFERILTTHTGSLPRPDDLASMILARDDGQVVDGLEQRVRAGVEEIVRRQREVGVDVVNDGEQSKISYATYIKDRLTGFEGEPSELPGGNALLRDHPDFVQRFTSQIDRTSFVRPRPSCTGPISRKDHTAVQQDIANLQAAAQGAGAQHVFMTAASPGVVALFFQNRYYPSQEAYLAAIADAMREEYRAIVDAGITLQLDCPDLAAGPSLHGPETARQMVAQNVEALNHAVEDIPPERLRLHVCWGNYDGPHEHDVELKDIVDLLLQARPAGLSIEACNPRHAHEWEVFQEVGLPEGKYLIPGVIESTNNFVEHPRVVAQRLLNYARVVGPERVMAGSDCGFGTFLGQGPVAPSIAWAKLQALAEGARLATQALSTTAVA